MSFVKLFIICNVLSEKPSVAMAVYISFISPIISCVCKLVITVQ